MAEPTTSGTTEIPFPVAPSPWFCRGEAFTFVTTIRASRDNASLLPGSFNDLEGESLFADRAHVGEYKGGLAMVMIVRYTDTPVGPYDELIWIPGKFSVPAGGPDALRITRIYVSTKESVYNGRKNWNICKAQAHFEFTPRPNATATQLPYSKISVAHPSDPSHPFFVVDLSSSMLTSAGIPVNTAYSPISMQMVHPPVPQSPNWREDGRVGTDKWWELTPGMKGKAGVVWAKGGLEGGKFGDGIGFPDVKLWSMGVWMRDFELDFGVGKMVGGSEEHAKTK
ncbi:hypothetical protein BXZ70DRAFT_944312 [Cristinia sonorae]|uniref:Acetoacetate decarboxylase n=1 Tax=Cristinia sonorae TaxID=1940300 RepID=A0A8K0UM22_9AGAR|nr:hypothetical protein BXZ70DRAFT_944312 [Cristinia sonorae]